LPQNPGARPTLNSSPKSQDLSKPENFHPKALTSAIRHKILALRLEHFLRSNDIINTRLKKGFLTNNNGTMVQIFATSAIVQNAFRMASFSQSLFLTSNAFGLVLHQLIYDMLAHIQLPFKVGLYISRAYCQLTAQVLTKNWSTPSFNLAEESFSMTHCHH